MKNKNALFLASLLRDAINTIRFTYVNQEFLKRWRGAAINQQEEYERGEVNHQNPAWQALREISAPAVNFNCNAAALK